MVKVSTPHAASSAVWSVSVRLEMGEGLAGSVRLIIWTPSSERPATTA